MNYFKSPKTLEELKSQYKKLAFQFHPDCGGTTEKMQQINNEYEKLFQILKNKHNTNENKKYTCTENSKEYMDIINKIIHMKVEIEICGSWVWIGGNSYPYRVQLKKLGFMWSKSKRKWYWYSNIKEQKKGYKKKGIAMSKIRELHGSEKINTQEVYSLV